jgi:hypothetical protein
VQSVLVGANVFRQVTLLVARHCRLHLFLCVPVIRIADRFASFALLECQALVTCCIAAKALLQHFSMHAMLAG